MIFFYFQELININIVEMFCLAFGFKINVTKTEYIVFHKDYNNNNNRRLVTLAEHTSDHGRQTNSSTEEKGEQV